MKITEDQKPAALVALFRASRAQGLGIMVAGGPRGSSLTREMAATALERSAYIDYLGGRVIKVDFRGDTLDFRLFDRDNGEGAGERAVRAALADGGAS